MTQRPNVLHDARAAGSTRTAARLLQMAADIGLVRQLPLLPVRVWRTRAGRHQRSAGAWSWILMSADGQELFGSADSARDILSAHGEGRVTAIHGSGTLEVSL